MRDKELDDLLVLGVLAKAKGESLNKYQIERSAEVLKRQLQHSSRKQFLQAVTHRAMRETIERLEERGQIRRVLIGEGRAPHTKTVFYALTELGKAALEREPEARSDFYIDVERARKIVEARWTPDAERAYQEMLIAYNWLVCRVGNLACAALAEIRCPSDIGKVARTMSGTLVSDFTNLMRACYRHRGVEVDGISPLGSVIDGFTFDEAHEESCRVWVENFAPSEFREYVGKLPNEVVAWAYLFSRSTREGLRDLQRAFKEFDASRP